MTDAMDVGRLLPARLAPQLSAARARKESMRSDMIATEASISETGLLHESFTFFRFAAVWLTRLLVPPSALPPFATALHLPLPGPSPRPLAGLPEHHIEDIASFLLYIGRQHPQVKSRRGFLSV